MHLATYSAADAGAMMAHYERRIGPRGHIDPEGRVYNAAADLGDQRARFAELCDGLEMGPRTRPLADLVVTMPKGCEIPQEEFFDAAYQILRNTLDESRTVSAYVHLDEPNAQPHMHFAFVPSVDVPVMTNDKTRPLLYTEKDERKNPEHVAGTQKVDGKGTPRWERVQAVGEDGVPLVRHTASASKVLSRDAMRQLHPAMEQALCKHFGVERVGITLDAGDARKTLSRLGHREYEEATKEVARAKQELVQVREQAADVGEQLQRATEQVAAKRAEADEKQAAIDRLESLRQGKEAENSGLDQRIGELERAIAECKQEPSEELERGQQPDAEPEQTPKPAAAEQRPEQKPDAEPGQDKWGHGLAETAKLVQAAGLGGARAIEAGQRSEAAEARELDKRIGQLEGGKREERSRHEGASANLERTIEDRKEKLEEAQGQRSSLERARGKAQEACRGLRERVVGVMGRLRQRLGVEGARAAWADVANKAKITERDISKDALTRIRALFPPRQPEQRHEPEVSRENEHQARGWDYDPERRR